jgi:hypothetical protein
MKHFWHLRSSAKAICFSATLVFAACAPTPSVEEPSKPGLELVDRGDVLPIDHPPVGGGGWALGGGSALGRRHRSRRWKRHWRRRGGRNRRRR